MTTLLNPDEWHRASAGRRQNVPRLATASVGSLLGALPELYGPYCLVAHRLVEAERSYRSSSTVVKPQEVESLVAEGVWQYFIVSELLSPDLLARLPDVDTRTLAVNGTVNLQIGRTDRSGALEPASLGIVDKVATSSGETREHSEYRAVFDAAVRAAGRQP